MKYKRTQSSRAELLRMVQRLFKQNVELRKELRAFRAFRDTIIERCKLKD
jgi:hypothetical protein